MKIVTVFKTHVDIGFTDLPLAVLSRYAGNMLVNAIETCENTEGNPKGKRFVWTLPAYPLEYALRHAAPEHRERAERLIRGGQLTWHALPFTLRTEFFSRQELSDSLLYSFRLAERYGVSAPRSAKMTDVPGHTEALVDVLVDGGIRFLHLGSNPAVTRPDVPTLFWWESASGNRILTYYNKNYGSEITPPKNWPYPVHLALIQSNDNCGVQSPEVIDRLCRQIGSDDELIVGTLDDFADEILACDLSDLPTVRGELGDSWIFALGHWPESVAAVREGRAIVSSVRERLDGRQWDELSDIYEQYLENALLFGEHSGGVDTKKYLSSRYYTRAELTSALCSEQYLYAKKGWDQERAFAFAAKDAALRLKGEAENRFGFCDKPKDGHAASHRYALTVKNDKICIVDTEKDRSISLSYTYEVAGKARIDAFLDEYLTTKYDWALEDFGRKNYPSCEDFDDTMILTELCTSDGKIEARYASSNSRADYGQADSVVISAFLCESGVLIRVDVVGKSPTLFAEAGHLVFDFGKAPTKTRVRKSSVWVDPARDVVRGAPTNLFCAEEVLFEETSILPYHSPLVSFGKSEFYRFCYRDYQRPENGLLYFMLFGNQIGTGSPQWLSGDVTAEFLLR